MEEHNRSDANVAVPEADSWNRAELSDSCSSWHARLQLHHQISLILHGTQQNPQVCTFDDQPATKKQSLLNVLSFEIREHDGSAISALVNFA